MSSKTDDISRDEKTPITLSPEEFNEYSRNVKNIFLNIGLLATSFWGPVIFILLLVALYYLDMLTTSDKTINILVVSSVALLVLTWAFIFKHIKRKIEEIYLNNIIILDPDLTNNLRGQQPQHKIRFKFLCIATAIVFILGFVLIALIQQKHPGNIGYTMLGIIAMILTTIIPLFFAIYSYSHIYIFQDIDNHHNF